MSKLSKEVIFPFKETITKVRRGLKSNFLKFIHPKVSHSIRLSSAKSIFQIKKSYTKKEMQLIRYIRKFGTPFYLLTGFRKSGNTWLRFIIYNYFNIKNNDARETLTFNQLNNIQKHSLEYEAIARFEPGFPYFYRTHLEYRKIFDFFKTIFIYRNPLDTLISYYYYRRNRKKPFDGYQEKERRKLFNINYFVQQRIFNWMIYTKRTLPKADFVICYEKLKKNPLSEVRKLISDIDQEYDESILKKSIEISSFNNVKRMAKETRQTYGMGAPESFKGEFMRSGKSRQYLKELQPRTIDYVERLLQFNGFYEEMDIL